MRVELAANALEPLIKLVNSKNEKVQELGARVLCACAVPDAAAAAWRKVNLKDLTVLLTNKDTPLKTQAIVCRTFASLAALGMNLGVFFFIVCCVVLMCVYCSGSRRSAG